MDIFILCVTKSPIQQSLHRPGQWAPYPSVDCPAHRQVAPWRLVERDLAWSFGWGAKSESNRWNLVLFVLGGMPSMPVHPTPPFGTQIRNQFGKLTNKPASFLMPGASNNPKTLKCVYCFFFATDAPLPSSACHAEGCLRSKIMYVVYIYKQFWIAYESPALTVPEDGTDCVNSFEAVLLPKGIHKQLLNMYSPSPSRREALQLSALQPQGRQNNYCAAL